jgi:hypothetical protein
MIRELAYGAAFAALAAGLAMADAGDPPARVARLNYRSGAVSFRPGSVEEWTDARVNYPLTTGDHLWTDAGAQTEMHAGSTAIRMAPETALSILNLDDSTAQFSLTEGAIDIHIRDLAPGEIFEVDTPNASISLLRPGDYRIDADADRGVATVTVREGEAEFTTEGAPAPTPVRIGERARITGTDTPALDIGAAPPPGEFDRWCEARDRSEEQAQSVRYVSRGTIGYEDLDAYGVWRDYAPYGWVWAPRVAAGWAPYRFGYWAWVEPWGWTWIAEEPWGFAPFHYGRWAYAGGGWLWVPGAVAARPVYAPALVAFVGGAGFTAGVAWFPLGPREVFRPAYRVSDAYVRQVNITHVNVVDINVTNVRYVNRDVAGGVTVVRQDDFVHARPVARAMIAVDAGEMARGQVIGTTASVAPRRESVLAAPAPAAVPAPPARFADHAVVARTAPPAPPVAFRLKQQALEANPGRPLDPGALDGLRRSAPAPAQGVRVLGAPQGGSRPANAGVAGPNALPPARRNAPQNDRPPRVVEQQNRPPAPAPEQPRKAENPPAASTQQPRKAETPPAPSRPAEAARPATNKGRAPAKNPKKVEKPPEK